MRACVLTGLFVSLLVGCGHDEAVSAHDLAVEVDLESPADLRAGPDPSEHPPLVLLNNLGGPILAHPKVWIVVWPNNSGLGAPLNEFVHVLLTSDYWKNSLAEYGVSDGTALGVINMPGPSPSNRDYLAFDDIVDGLAVDPQHLADDETIYVLLLPSDTLVTVGGANYCQIAGGTHDSTSAGNKYALIPDCGFPASGIPCVLSHELAEAATDPMPLNQPTWQSALPPAEVADLCNDLSTSISGPADADGGTVYYSVTRLYSTKTAAAGTADPCVPAPSATWFNTAIEPMAMMAGAASTGFAATAMVAPYAVGTVGHISWHIDAPGFAVNPSSGSSAPGERIPVTFRVTTATSGPWPVYITSSSSAGKQYAEAGIQVP
jgi:hypothetical protein